MMKWPFMLLIASTSLACNASTVSMQCGNFKLDLIPDSMFQINGETVTSQKVKMLGENGMKVDMGLMPARNGNMYGFQYVHPNGSSKRWLNVQLLQNAMDAPKIIGSFPCKKVAD
ncbi:hypothetical protein J8V12_11120 [Photorhabdus thracensis]|nr:hypothetical protein [Photorhabdus thracensis]